MSKLRVAIIGATGYTGLELVRILLNHPYSTIDVITSESHPGKLFSDIHPHLKGIADIPLEPMQNIVNHSVDIIFLALPHGVSMEFVKKYGYEKFKVIDLSGDLRIKDIAVYEKWYKVQHLFHQALKDVVFGLPELFAEKIKNSNLVANPGCYPTASILPLAPLLKADLIDNQSIIIDSKSGVTGAGAKAKENTHFPLVYDNFMAYGLMTHRHTPEIELALSEFTGKPVTVQFSPHLLPVNRGILSTIYTRPIRPVTKNEISKLLKEFYADKPFVKIVDQPPSLKDVRGSNYCHIFGTFDERTGFILLVSVIDNLVKGASGQAIQNMNLMFDLDETTGLLTPPLSP